MSRDPSARSLPSAGPTARYSVRETAAATAAVSLSVFLGVLALTLPAFGVVVGAAGLTLASVLRARQGDVETETAAAADDASAVCVPGTDVCVGV